MTAAVPAPPPAARGGRSAPPAFHGLLRVDKPAGPTSHDVVARVRARLGAPGAGHLGTLDPGATGLLLVAVGAATRAIPLWQGGEKTYEAELRLGVTTDTQDLDGAVLAERPVDAGADALREAARAFVGELEQVPPMVSALKVRGERLHARARRGETVDRAPRRVVVARWEWLAIEPPSARFRVRCSAGTYVRTLVHDLGARLGCGAALAALRRLRSEPFGLEGAITLEGIEAGPPEAVWASAGIPLDRALAHLPAVLLDAAEAEAVGFGRRVVLDAARLPAGAAALGPRGLVLRGPDGLVGLGDAVPDPGGAPRAGVGPQVVFPWALREGGR